MIIGLSGKKFSGKDTCADYLARNHKFEKIAFAFFLKESLKILFGWNDDAFDPDKKEKEDTYWGITPREICQLLGTDFLRDSLENKISHKFTLHNGVTYYSSFHIKRLNILITELIKQKKNIVFTDIRFEDEFNYVKALGGKVIKIERDGIGINEFSNHISEKNIDTFDNFDFIIENNDTKELLYNELNRIILDKHICFN